MKLKKYVLVFIPLLIILNAVIVFLDVSWWWLFLFCLLSSVPLIAGAIYIQQNFFVESINSLHDSTLPHKKDTDIVLTFDDGIHPIHTPKVLDILQAHGVKAMFFIIGKNIHQHAAILKRIADEGHTIGNHSFTHGIWFDMKSISDMAAELNQMNEAVVDILGKEYTPVYFRPPYGVTNPNLANAIKRTGMTSVGWNLRSMDTVAKSKMLLLDKLKKMTRKGSIVLLHDRCAITVDTLTDYIVFCKQQGFTFTTL